MLDPDNEKGRRFSKLNVMDWIRVLHIYFSVCRAAASHFFATYFIRGLI